MCVCVCVMLGRSLSFFLSLCAARTNAVGVVFAEDDNGQVGCPHGLCLCLSFPLAAQHAIRSNRYAPLLDEHRSA